jgi:hypothetical protein
MAYRQAKLRQLAEDWGMSALELVRTYAFDDVAPGICLNDACNFSTEYEPDQQHGWCEECATGSVCSALVLAEVI